MKRVIVMVVSVLLMALYAVAAFADDRFVFSDQTVKDKRTGLVWSRDANLGARDWNGAFEFVKELNKKKYAGFKDWRLPSKEDLETLLTYANGIGGIPLQIFNQMGFYDVTAAYWSSSAHAADGAWYANFVEGEPKTFPTFSHKNVWPVRGRQ